MAVFARHRTVRLSVLLAILAALVPGLIFHATHTSTSGLSTAPPLTPAQKSAAQAALDRVNPPATFRRYTSWRLGTSPETAVPCLARPAICFGSGDVVRPLTLHAATTLPTTFHIRMGQASCGDGAGLPISSCNGSATIPGYKLGFIVTVEHPRARTPAPRHTSRPLRDQKCVETPAGSGNVRSPDPGRSGLDWTS